MAITTLNNRSINRSDTASADQVWTATSATASDFQAGGGLTEADSWRLNASVSMTASSNTTISSSWERADTDGFGLLGTGLSESSGIFSFPSTGYWYINFSFYKNANAAADNYSAIELHTTPDNSTYNAAGHATGHFPATADNIQMSNSFLIDVTDISNIKFKFNYYAGQTNQIIGDTGRHDSGFTALKLADT